jgi:hypothetical protein
MASLTRRGLLGSLAALPASGLVRPRQAVAQAIAGAPVASDPVEVDVSILFARDVSRSMDQDDERLLREGYLAAFRSPEVVTAIQAGTLGRIACAVVQWSGVHQQRLTVPWTIIGDEASASAFGTAIDAQRRTFNLETYITGAIRFCVGELERSRAVATPLFGSLLNVSGDGADTYSHDYLRAERDQAIAAGITINGLPVVTGGNWHSNSRQAIPSATLPDYYRDHVIGGPGAFLVEAAGYADIGRAVIRKLVQEIASARTMGATRRG